MSQTREAARERARQLRDEHRKRDRRRSLLVFAGVFSGILIAGLIIALVLVTADKRGGRGPANMLSDGIKIGEGFVAERTPALGAKDEPTPFGANPADVVAIQIYYDYHCPNCGLFEQRNAAQMRAWLDTGAVTIEFHPIAVFSSKVAHTEYSAHAANAAACVAEYSPDTFYAFHEALFANQPDENSSGLSDEELIDTAKSAGVERMTDVTTCIETGRFRGWVAAATERAVQGPLVGTDVPGVQSTPTIVVNGQEFAYTTAFDPNEFAQFVARAAGQSFSENPQPTPTPTPTETPAP